MKNKIGELIKNKDFIVVLMALIPFLFGTFHDFSVFAVSLIFLVLILCIYIKNKKIIIKVNLGLILSGVLFIFSVFSILWAVDRNDASFGALRYLSILIFNILLMQLTNDRKENMIKIIPYSAVLMLIISVLLGFIPSARDFVYTPAGNIMGFFPYANTFALYMFLGIIIITNKNKEIADNKESSKKEKKIIIEFLIVLILIIGIYLTGSKTTLILLALYLIYFILNKKHAKTKYYFITYLSLFIIMIGLLFALNKMQIIDISSSFGTVLERLLYFKDSLKLIFKNPFGLRIYGIFI